MNPVDQFCGAHSDQIASPCTTMPVRDVAELEILDMLRGN